MNGQIHFIGAGGVGVSGVAHLALDLGYGVSCSDACNSRMLETLRERGVPCCIGHCEALPAGTDTVVYSSAVPATDTERQWAQQHGIRQIRRGDFLNELALHFKTRVAVSGSHGKTTTSAMIAHILRQCGVETGYLIGGGVNGWTRAACAGDGRVLVSEVDESDGSQSGFPATLALVLGIDDDHSWALGGSQALEECFAALCRHASMVLCWSTPVTQRVFGDWPNVRYINEELPLDTLLGWHNRMDGAMAVAAAEICGVPRERAVEALRSFPGVSRRLSLRYQSGDRVLIEDYAHHPTELRASLEALREQYKGAYLMVAFQPHRNERVERYGAEFGRILSCADWVGLTDAFGAWRTDGQHCDVPGSIGSLIPQGFTWLEGSFTEIARQLYQEWSQHEKVVLAVIGAGDITRVIQPFVAECK